MTNVAVKGPARHWSSGQACGRGPSRSGAQAAAARERGSASSDEPGRVLLIYGREKWILEPEPRRVLSHD